MKAGKLRNRITIQQKTSTTNENGFPEKAWTDYVTLWAELQPLQGKEYFKANTEQSTIDKKIICRYYPSITPDMRIKYSDCYFNIQSVMNVNERNRELEIMATERLDDHE